MSWNYRVFRLPGDEFSEAYYAIKETYYDEEGEPRGWTVDYATPTAESLADLKWALEQMLLALDKPVLEEKNE